MNIIKIKCPNCGATFKSAGTSPEQIIQCPVCKQAYPASAFKEVDENRSHDETMLSFGRSGSSGQNPGSVVDEKTRKEYRLAIGKNLIGRMTYKAPPKATVPIETDDAGMSRSHLYIDVMKGRDGKLHSYASNAGNVNPTYINGNLLEADDQIALKNGDKISFSSTVLRFSEEEYDDKTII